MPMNILNLNYFGQCQRKKTQEMNYGQVSQIVVNFGFFKLNRILPRFSIKLITSDWRIRLNNQEIHETCYKMEDWVTLNVYKTSCWIKSLRFIDQHLVFSKYFGQSYQSLVLLAQIFNLVSSKSLSLIFLYLFLNRRLFWQL